MYASASVLLVLFVFRSSFAENMDIIITADNYFDLYVNDEFIDGEQGHEEWRTAGEYTVPVRNGKNVIAVLGMDGGLSEGVLAQITLPDGTKLGTSKEWKTSNYFAFNWYSSSFDDSRWPSAMEIADAGSGAWGDRVTNFPSGSPAKWIWRQGANPENREDGSVSQFRFTFAYGSAPDADFTLSKGNEASMSIDVSASGGDRHAWDFGDGATAKGKAGTITMPDLLKMLSRPTAHTTCSGPGVKNPVGMTAAVIPVSAWQPVATGRISPSIPEIPLSDRSRLRM